MPKHLKRAIPRISAEITAAALDGDPMTGLEVETAQIGSAIDIARQRFALDGDAATHALDDVPLPRSQVKLPSPFDFPSPRPRGH